MRVRGFGVSVQGLFFWGGDRLPRTDIAGETAEYAMGVNVGNQKEAALKMMNKCAAWTDVEGN